MYGAWVHVCMSMYSAYLYTYVQFRYACLYMVLFSVLCRIKMLPVVGHVLGLRETLRVRAATANVTLTLMKYTYAYII